MTITDHPHKSFVDELKTAIDKFGEAATEFDAKVQAVDDKTR